MKRIFITVVIHFINNFSHRTQNLYDDTGMFLELFDDLNTSVDFKKNEFMLKHFFQPKDPKLRKEIDVFCDVDSIESGKEDNRINMMDVKTKII